MTSEEEATRLLKEDHEKRSLAKKLSQDAETEETDADEGRYRVLLEDKFEAVVLGDYGSDFSAIPPRVVDEITKVCPDFVVKGLKTPLKLILTFNTESEVSSTASRSVVMTVTIIAGLTKRASESEESLALGSRT